MHTYKSLLYYYKLRSRGKSKSRIHWYLKFKQTKHSLYFLFLEQQKKKYLQIHEFFIISFNNCHFPKQLCTYTSSSMDKKLNVYLCSSIHCQNSPGHMHIYMILLYCCKPRLNGKGCLNIHRYLRCWDRNTTRFSISLTRGT